MDNIKKRLGNLLSVKSLVTLVLTGVFAYMAVAGKISQDFMTIYAVIIAFYFGTRARSFRMRWTERTVQEMPVIKDALTSCNHSKGGCRPKYIVVHYFGALGTAASVAEWFRNPQARASAHYAVDEGNVIYRCVKEADIAWHCGDGQKHPECRNWNSIGVEVRPRKVNKARLGAYDTDWYFDEATLENAVWLIRRLMKQYNIPAENVIRHYDVSGKMCPRPFVGDDINTHYNTSGNVQWARFKERIDDEVVEKSKMIVDGKEVAVERILKNGTNYVKIRDIAAALNLKVSNKGSIAVLETK